MSFDGRSSPKESAEVLSWKPWEVRACCAMFRASCASESVCPERLKSLGQVAIVGRVALDDLGGGSSRIADRLQFFQDCVERHALQRTVADAFQVDLEDETAESSDGGDRVLAGVHGVSDVEIDA